jgi:putative MFS transporter
MFSEFLRAHNRGKVGMLFQILYPIGAILSPVLGVVTLKLFDSDTAWRVLFLIGGLPILLAVICHYRLPESPHGWSRKAGWAKPNGS